RSIDSDKLAVDFRWCGSCNLGLATSSRLVQEFAAFPAKSKEVCFLHRKNNRLADRPLGVHNSDYLVPAHPRLFFHDEIVKVSLECLYAVGRLAFSTATRVRSRLCSVPI